ncbi:MAG: ATP-dependent RecD-like DNA helicase [Clostridia bacterium]|nr:ATP-dependent RecD-like DNA helicase [Clostridia bacterium]
MEKNDKDVESVEGAVERITYQNKENGYTVCVISRETVDGKTEDLTLVGIMPYLSVGETVKAIGSWGFHQTFGRQFNVEYFEKQLPTTESAMLRYLSSRTIKGVGPKVAAKIVAAFGESTFEVIEKDPGRLATLQGISRAKAEEISQSFKEQFGVRAVMMFCRDHFGPATAVRIYKRWGSSAVDVMKSNPYMLCDEISGIGFEKADRVAMSMGVEENSPLRIRAGVCFVLSYNARQNGHTLVPKDKLVGLTCNLLNVSEQEVVDSIDALSGYGKVVISSLGGRECVWLAEYRKAEKYISEKLFLLEKSCKGIAASRAERIISQVEREENIEYDPTQKKAIMQSLCGGVLLLTGGPGTGKTTVIRAIIRLYEELGLSTVLAAPTGRAAKRMSEATGKEAKTVHRLLEMMYSGEGEPKFMRDENNPFDEDAVIIDEASMIDTLLMASLLKAVKRTSHLILIGDADQLPSVGAGNVLNELLNCDYFHAIRLKKIFRQAGESLIVTNAHAINAGELPELSTKNNDFFFLTRDTEQQTAATVADLCINRLPRKYGASIREGIQVITPSHKGAAGTESLNVMLQSALNPPSPRKNERKVRGIVFREGDKVMQIKNDYDMVWVRGEEEGCGVFNGDIGVITDIDSDDEKVTVNFDGRITEYDFTLLDELEHAYAITVHKSQGSEYPVVILPVYNCGDRLATRNLLYTAVTRAQDMVVMVGDLQTVQRMVMNNRQTRRYTGLSYILEDVGKAVFSDDED